jgi:selenocysteine lyase/cysteine desulfurase
MYADWTASGRMFHPIEKRLNEKFFPLVANTHTDTNYTGSAMTTAYHEAKHIIKKHVGAGEHDVMLSSDSGMTGVINKFQRILGLRIHENFKSRITIDAEERPVVFVTHMEHHSNQTSWIETIAEVVIVPPDETGLVSIENFRKEIERYPNRKLKIAAVTSCSNVTGILTPYNDIAKLIHEHGGLCFVDFACCAPYVDIDMHLDDSDGKYLDALYFSPHKFLGGPGSTGVLVFNGHLYRNAVPDNPGGGTVEWTNPWGDHRFVQDIETREDGGTPPFLQTIKAALCIQLKEEMGVPNMLQREEEILGLIWNDLSAIPNLHILASSHQKRLGVIAFHIEGLHYNVGVKLLNDKFGIQTRGGCSCAGTYGHYLLNLSKDYSSGFCSLIDHGDISKRPGWIRMSVHPTHSNTEIKYLTDAVKQLAANFSEWQADYNIDYAKGFIAHKQDNLRHEIKRNVEEWMQEKFAS